VQVERIDGLCSSGAVCRELAAWSTCESLLTATPCLQQVSDCVKHNENIQQMLADFVIGRCTTAIASALDRCPVLLGLLHD